MAALQQARARFQHKLLYRPRTLLGGKEAAALKGSLHENEERLTARIGRTGLII